MPPVMRPAPLAAPAHDPSALAASQTLQPDDVWLVAALVPLLCLLPVLWRVATGTPRERLVAQNLAQLLGALALLLCAQGFGRPSYQDLALLLAVLAPAGTLVYARFLGGVPAAPTVRRAALLGVPLTVLPLCVATGPGRDLVKLLAIGLLLLAGCLVTSAGSLESVEQGATEPDEQARAQDTAAPDRGRGRQGGESHRGPGRGEGRPGD